MGMGMYFLQVTKEQLDEIEEDEDLFHEMSNELDESSFGFDSEFSAIDFLLNDDVFGDDAADSPDYSYTEESFEDVDVFYHDVTNVKYIAECLSKFTEDDLRRRFLSDAFKNALSSGGNNQIYRGGTFGDEEYFKELWLSVSGLSTYFIEAAKQKKAMLFWYV